jgi:hypothetical protein
MAQMKMAGTPMNKGETQRNMAYSEPLVYGFTGMHRRPENRPSSPGIH